MFLEGYLTIKGVIEKIIESPSELKPDSFGMEAFSFEAQPKKELKGWYYDGSRQGNL